MPNQEPSAPQAQSKEAQAEKLRRVLSVKEPVPAQNPASEAQNKPATR